MAKKIKDPGIGYQSNKNVKSFLTENGKSAIIHVNRPKSIDDLYTYLISLSWIEFLIYVFVSYVLINTLFAFTYLAIGIEELIAPSESIIYDFINAFFFSAQTLTTLGYGAIAPSGIASGLVSSFEALAGLLGFSFITGLLYGRFSKPKAAIRFSKSLIYRPFEDSYALMFRLMSKRKSIMIEPSIDATLAISEKNKNGEFKQNFYQLTLERNKITYLPTMWTVVHKINEKSPLKGLSEKEMTKLDAKLYILFQYHEESFAQKVYQIFSYDFKKLKTGVQFKKAVNFNEEGYYILDHEDLDSVEKINE